MEFIIGADISFSLYDESASKLIWSQRFSATAKTKVAGVFLTADDCLRLLPQTFGEVLGQVFGSPSFRAALRRGHAEA